jgi:hypothetical protein
MKVGSWSIEDWCNEQTPSSWEDDVLSSSSLTRDFVQRLNLTFVHPFCNPTTVPKPYPIPGVPEQGPLLNYDHIETWYDALVTLVAKSTPALAAMMELWLRLFSFFIAPMSIMYLIYIELDNAIIPNTTDKISKETQYRLRLVSLACLMSCASSVVLLTDTLYVLEYGPTYGGTLLGLSIMLSWNTCTKYSLQRTRYGIASIAMLCAILVYDHNTGTIQFGERNDIPVSIEEGLYYSSKLLSRKYFFHIRFTKPYIVILLLIHC